MTSMSTTKIPVEKFKAIAIAGGKEAVEGLALTKAYPSEISATEGEARVITVKASTKAADRDNDTIDPKGWQLGNFTKNGPILWAHDSRQLPVGKARKTWIEDDALRAEIEFPEKGLYPFADTVYDLCKAGFLNAVSVGFIPTEWKMNQDRGDFAMDFLKQELLEISIVPIPSNPEALVEARSANGIDIEPLTQWAESTLEGVRGKGFWVPVAKRPEVKAGRVLSAANEQALLAAVETIDMAVEKIEAVLSQVAPQEDAAPPANVKAEEPPPSPPEQSEPQAEQDGEMCEACEGSGVCKGCGGSGKKPAKEAPTDDAGKSVGELLAGLDAKLSALKAPAKPSTPTFLLDEERVSSTIARRVEESLIGPLLGRVPNNH